MTLVKEEVCKGCKEEIEVYETKIIGGPNKGDKMRFSKGCKCEDMKLAKKAEESHKKAITRRMREHFDYYSLISKRLRMADLESYIPENKSQAIAKKSIEKYVDIFNINNPVNLLIIGSYGVGKSHLAKSLTDKIMEKGHTSIFISVPKLFRKIRSTYNKSSDISEEDIFEVLETVDVLVLDDLGAHRQSDWSEERLFDVIDSRQGMHTIYTSNYDEHKLLGMLGERNFSRVVNEDTKIIEIEGDNYRLKDLKNGGN